MGKAMLKVYLIHPHGCGWSNGSLFASTLRAYYAETRRMRLHKSKVWGWWLSGNVPFDLSQLARSNLPEPRSVIDQSMEVRYDLPDFRRRMLAAERRSGN
jgi:hypothetical protein